eukprot:gnl/TRDRNA2_/TRDRNA2_203803_c0_seq1.p2 gnl/TRDRNA2_/TRDRNA2_203803_c0~~gnl/TRDRNA2_/TRDRNA2_203803_c0_seq1.p2  ORF type:complete len:159 (-),score=25.98 gnl/TRDRNA2_/TRDRNA2_203803_c0_seq1:76-498(-)
MLSEDVLVPLRFLTTVGQLLGTLAVALDRDPHIIAGLPLRYTPPEFDAAQREFTIVLTLSILALVFELYGLFSGLSFFGTHANSLHCCLHGFGCALVTAFAIGSAHFALFWYLFAVASVLPVIIETTSLLGVSWLRQTAY